MRVAYAGCRLSYRTLLTVRSDDRGHFQHTMNRDLPELYHNERILACAHTYSLSEQV